MDRWCLNKPEKLPGEAMPDYIVTLCQVSRQCELKTWLDVDSICKFIGELSDARVQWRFPAEANLILDEVKQFAQTTQKSSAKSGVLRWTHFNSAARGREGVVEGKVRWSGNLEFSKTNITRWNKPKEHKI